MINIKSHEFFHEIFHFSMTKKTTGRLSGHHGATHLFQPDFCAPGTRVNVWGDIN
jgi:hypothetical protein